MGDITALLARAGAGEREAFNAIFERLYPELQRIARARLAGHERSPELQTTALVHECYLKLLQASRLTPRDRAHFLGYAAHAMRSVVVDTVRANGRLRRGGDVVHVTLVTAAADGVSLPEDEILDVDSALQELAKLDERLVRVVEMRYFAGMSDAEIAAALGVTDRTVRRDWEKARLLLAAALKR
jgi:RNA polymerase sigma factor (TIGR02999 family)